jgi:Leucine-rich repeat (LRR) protein
LTGELDLSEFTNLKEVYISYFVDEDELEIKDKEKYKIIKLVNAQEYLLENYPKKEDRKKHKELDISSKNLEGSLKLEGFTNLQKVNCSQNQLVELDLSDCSKLIEVDC